MTGSDASNNRIQPRGILNLRVAWRFHHCAPPAVGLIFILPLSLCKGVEDSRWRNLTRPQVKLFEVATRALRQAKATTPRRSTMTIIEVSVAERDLLKKILDSYLSELRQAIAATKRDTLSLHEEENLIKELQKKLSEAT
jgi:hypothetical protein